MRASKTRLSVSALTLAAVLASPAAAQVFGSTQALNTGAATDSGTDFTADVESDGAGNWVAVWNSRDTLGGTIGTDLDILVARSTDDGVSWTDPAPLYPGAAGDSGNDFGPDLCTDGNGTWLVVWESSESFGGTLGTDSDIVLSRSTDGGVTWSAPQAVNTNAAVDTGDDQLARIETDGAGLWLVVWDSRDSLGGTIGTDNDVLAARSTNAGVTWTAPGTVNSNAIGDIYDDAGPKLATDRMGNWVVLWMSDDELDGTLGTDSDVMVSRSTNGGLSWSSIAALDPRAAGNDGLDYVAFLATDRAGTWLAAWHSTTSLGGTIGSDWDIVVSRSTDAGATWTASVLLDPRGAADSGNDQRVRLAGEGNGRWLAIWSSRDTVGDTLGADEDILVSRSTDGGLTWEVSAPIDVEAATDEGDDFYPYLATDRAGTWLATWYSNDTRGGTLGTDFDVLFARGTSPAAVVPVPALGDVAGLALAALLAVAALRARSCRSRADGSRSSGGSRAGPPARENAP